MKARMAALLFLPSMAIADAGPAGAQTTFGPSPESSSFWITEAGLSFWLGESASSTTRLTATAEFGHAWNTGGHSAWGATAFMRAGGDKLTGIGVRPRYRYWFGRYTALDVAPGFRFWNKSEDFRLDFSGQLGISHHEVGFVLQADTVWNVSTFHTKGRALHWCLGVRMGHGWGAIGLIFACTVAAFTTIFD